MFSMMLMGRVIFSAKFGTHFHRIES